MEAAWPLVERARQLQLVADVVRRPSARALVISGPAGVGKTRLVTESLQRLRKQKVPVQWVVASEAAAGLPFAAVAHLLADAPSGAAPLELLVRTRQGIERATHGRRLVVGVDDAHLLDDASATLLGHLATSGTAHLVCTLRGGQALPGPIAALVTVGQGEQVDLDQLSAEAVRAVLSAVLGGQVDGAAVHRVRTLSSGNPLLLRELYEDAERRSAWQRRGDLWRLDASWTPRAGLSDVMGSRLDALDATVREAAEALALAEPLEASLLESLFDPRALAGLDAAGLLEALPDRRRQRVRLVHPLYGEQLRAAVPPLRARDLYRRLSDALAATGARRRGDAQRLASWWLAAGVAGDGATLTTAARQAQMTFDNELAERLARAGLQSGGGLGAALALADALAWQGRTAEAEAVLLRWDSATPDDVSTQLALAGLYGSSADAAGVDELLDKAEALVGEGRGRDQVTALRADRAVGRWRPAEALRLTRPLVADPMVEADTLVVASETTAAAMCVAGLGDSAVEAADRALGVLERGATDVLTANVLAGPLRAERVCGHLLAGRLDVGRQLARAEYDAALEASVAPPRAWFGMLLGFADVLSGQVDSALVWLRESVELMREHRFAQGRHIRVWALGTAAEAEAMAGDPAAGRLLVAEADDVLDADVPVGSRGLGRAWVEAASGDLATARAVLDGIATATRAAGAHAFEALALHDALRLAGPGEDIRGIARRLDALVEVTEGDLVPVLARHAQALAASDPAALDLASARLAALGLLPRAAEAAAHASRAWAAVPDGHAAGASAERARELAAACPGWRSPVLGLDSRHDPYATVLTSREREIAALAADGRSSRDIADTLVISVRTVENHLQRAYAKLGITRREDLPAPRR